MLRAYQQSATSRGVHDSTGPWTLKDRTDIDPSVRGRTVSTHILGLGIVLVGVLFLAIGLIMGFEFPKYVYEKNKEAQCVLRTTHDNYLTWVQGTQWKRKVKLYYWALENKDQFLYNGEKPRFRQRGPFVYTHEAVKRDVRFAVTEVHFVQVSSLTFDQMGTQEECTTCQEFEKLTILSPWYQRLLYEHGDEFNLAWSHVPTYVISNLVDAGLATGDHTSVTFRTNISLLGGFQSSNAVSDRPLSDYSFGTWFRSSSGAFKAAVESNTIGGSFSDSEIRAVYKVFTNASLLLGKQFSSGDGSTDATRSTLQQNCDRWAEEVCSSTSNSYSFSGSSAGLSECGIARVLYKCHNDVNDNDTSVYSSIVNNHLYQTFCPEDGDYCLNFTNMQQSTALAYTSALSGFMLDLTSTVLDLVLASQKTDIVISRNQSDFALGFHSDVDADGRTVHYKGFLESFRTGDNVSTKTSRWKMYTCLQNRNTGNNMKVKEYNGLRSVPDGLLKAGSPRVSLESQTDFADSCSLLRACVACAAPIRQMKVFVEDLLRPVAFMHNGTTEYKGVDVQVYDLSAGTFSNSSHILAADNFQDVTALTGHQAWVSPPQVKTDSFDLLTNQDVESSQLFVESVTGKVWKRTFKWQMNIGLNPSTAHMRGRSIASSLMGVALPVFWVDKVADLTDGELGDYKHLVARLMAVSCGGLIGFSILAVITAIVGVIVCFYPSKPNRVLPMADDAVSSTSTGRHP